MAMRIRSLKPEFWASFSIAKLTEPAVILAIGLLNYSDDHGYFEADPRLVRAALFPLRELSATLPRLFGELAGIGYAEFRHAPETGRLLGHVVNFESHQRVDKPRDSKLAELFAQGTTAQEIHGIPENVANLPRLFSEASPTPPEKTTLDQGSGNREQGAGMAPRDESPKSDDATRRSADRQLPAELDTPAFRSAWERWLVYWSEQHGRGRPMNELTALSHLKILLTLGAEQSAVAIENSISRGLREPALPLNTHGNDRTSNRRGFELQNDYSGVTDKL